MCEISSPEAHTDDHTFDYQKMKVSRILYIFPTKNQTSFCEMFKFVVLFVF